MKIKTGYEGTNVPDDFFIPPNGIEETDRALFNLFDKKIAFEVEVNSQVTKVPVVFSSGERFATTRRRQPIRDRNNALILPIVSIHRTSIIHDPNQDGYNTAISFRKQGDYVIKRRLSDKDRQYQKLINKLLLKNQDDVASLNNFSDTGDFPKQNAIEGRVASRREKGNMSRNISTTGQLLKNNLGENIFEIITIPYPKFITIQYELIFWTQYMTQMNHLIESMMSRFDGQGHQFSMTTQNGYDLVAFLKSPMTAEDNFSDFSSDERIIKYAFNISVPTFIIAPQQPGLSSPFRRYYSAPSIEFGIKQVSTEVFDESPNVPADNNINDFILSDVQILDKKGREPLQRGQDSSRFLVEEQDPFDPEQKRPALRRVLTRNQRQGETVVSARIIKDLDTVSD